MKKLLAAALIISVFFGIHSGNAFAAVNTQTWTGAAGDGKTSTAGNWDVNEAPQAGDILKFPASTAGNINFDSYFGGATQIVFGSTGDTTHRIYNVTGSVQMIYFKAVGDIEVNLNGATTFDDNSVNTATAHKSLIDLEDAASSVDINGALVLGNDVQQIEVGPAGSVAFLQTSFLGSLQLLTFTGTSTGVLNGVTSFNGGVNSSPQILRLDGTDATHFPVAIINNTAWLGSSSTIIDDYSMIYLPTGSPINNAFTLSNHTTILPSYFQSANTDPITLSGDIDLTGQNTYAGTSGGSRLNDLVLTGNLNSSGTISPTEGTVGSVIVNPGSGKTNSSTTPNGETKPANKITTVASGSSTSVASTIFANNTLVVNGTVTNNLTISSGAILKGSGTTANIIVSTGGIVAPGNSPGCLSTNNATIAGTYQAELGGTTPCTEYDQLKVTGTVNLSGSTLELSRYNNFEPAVGNTFTIIDNDSNDAVTGTFAGLAEGATVTINGYTFTISYVGGDGNDVVLTVTAVASNAPTTDPQSAATPPVPGTPNTGVKLLMANPLMTLAGATLSAGALFVLSRKYKLFVK